MTIRVLVVAGWRGARAFVAIQRLVKTWPGNIASARANALGLLPDTDFETVIREYIRENPQAVKLPVSAGR